jgi:signal peptidase II
MMRSRLSIFALIGLVLLLDQLSKQWVVGIHGMAAGWIAAPLPFFNLVLVWNRGISFGLFSHHPEWMPWILLGLTSLMTLVLACWLSRTPRRLTQIGLSMVIGGAMGNIIDRLHYGAVVDFLDFHLFGRHWPAFNIADSAIFIGVVFLLWDSVKEGKEKITI